MARVEQEVLDAISVHDRIEEVTYIAALAIRGNVYSYLSYRTDDSLDGQSLLELG